MIWRCIFCHRVIDYQLRQTKEIVELIHGYNVISYAHKSCFNFVVTHEREMELFMGYMKLLEDARVKKWQNTFG